jgi:hypothetical protein
MRLIGLVLAVTLAGGAAPDAQEQSPSQFLSSLQQAVARNDRRAVAGMMRYPLDVTAAGLQIPVADANTFVKLYDSMMSSTMKDVIARARIPPEGKIVPGVVRAPNGSISFDRALTIAPSGGGFRVTRLAVPTSSRSSASGEPVERKLTFRAGQATQVSGSLDPNGRDRYVFYARRGVLVDVRLTGVPGSSVLVRVVDAATGKPLDARADAGARVWSGRPGADGNYRIEVVRQPDTGKETLIYTMAVALK